jgi:hypothetical protein
MLRKGSDIEVEKSRVKESRRDYSTGGFSDATGFVSPQSVDNVRVGNEEVGARRRLAPTGSTLRVIPDGA